MCSTGIGFKTNPQEIASGSFPAIMIRRMVEVQTGETSDAEYELALRAATQKLGLKYCNGKLELGHMSRGTIDYISNQIAEIVIAGRPEKAEAF